jgi:hypothetical protein
MWQTKTSLRLGIILGTLALGGTTALAQTEPADNTAPYRSVYETSQAIFDQCGDVARGDLYRKVVREKADKCPLFSDSEKANFRSWADARSAAFAKQSAEAAAKGAVPGTPEEQHRCKALQEQPSMREAFRRIDRYGRGQAGADEVIQEACERTVP